MKTRILIVDDDPLLLGLLETLFEPERYAVRTAENGEKALWMAQAEPPDVVILDALLPGINGYQVCAHLRKITFTRRVRVLMLTAQSAMRDAEAGLRAGADDYMTKPFSAEEVLFRVEALARRGPPPTTRHRRLTPLPFARALNS